MFARLWQTLTEEAKAVLLTLSILIWINLLLGLVVAPAMGWGGKTLVAGDITQPELIEGKSREIAIKEGSCDWFPYIFSGMPATMLSWFREYEDPEYTAGLMVGVLLMMVVGMESVKEERHQEAGMLGGYLISIPTFFIEGMTLLLGLIILMYYEAERVGKEARSHVGD